MRVYEIIAGRDYPYRIAGGDLPGQSRDAL